MDLIQITFLEGMAARGILGDNPPERLCVGEAGAVYFGEGLALCNCCGDEGLLP